MGSEEEGEFLTHISTGCKPDMPACPLRGDL
jgi:hypothetical protein